MQIREGEAKICTYLDEDLDEHFFSTRDWMSYLFDHLQIDHMQLNVTCPIVGQSVTTNYEKA